MPSAQPKPRKPPICIDIGTLSDTKAGRALVEEINKLDSRTIQKTVLRLYHESNRRLNFVNSIEYVHCKDDRLFFLDAIRKHSIEAIDNAENWPPIIRYLLKNVLKAEYMKRVKRTI